MFLVVRQSAQLVALQHLGCWLVALSRRFLEPISGRADVFGDNMARKIGCFQQVLGVGIALLG